MPSEPNPSANPEPEPPKSGGTKYSPTDVPEGYTYVPESERNGLPDINGGWLDTVKFYLNMFGLFMIATVVLILGFLAINSKTIVGATVGGKAKLAATAVSAIKGK